MLNLDFKKLKDDFRTLFNELYNDGKMERVNNLDFHMEINKFVYCEDLYEEVKELNKKYNENKEKHELSQFWVKLKSDPTTMNDLLGEKLHLDIFAQYENPNDIFDSLEALNNSQLFEFTRWMGSRVSEKPSCLPAVNSEYTRTQAIVTIIEKRYSDKFGVRAGHFKQIIRILKNGKTDYDPEYIQEENK